MESLKMHINEEEYQDEESLHNGISDDTSERIESLRDEIEDPSIHSFCIQNINELLLSDAEYFKKVFLSNTIDSMITGNQKEQFTKCLLDGLSSSSSSATGLRNNWIVNSKHLNNVSEKKNQDNERDKLISHGKLLKQKENIFKHWNDVECELYCDRLQVFCVEGGGKRLTDCINFRYFNIAVEINEGQLSVIMLANGVTLRLKQSPLSEISIVNWFESIQHTIDNWNGSKKVSMKSCDCEQILNQTNLKEQMKMNQDPAIEMKLEECNCELMNKRRNILIAMTKLDVVHEDELVKNAQSGDIFLFQTQSLGAKLQRVTTSSRYDHVGMIIRLTDNVLRILEAMGEGVELTPWNKFLETNDFCELLVYRKLSYSQKERILPELYTFVNQVIGQKYALNFGKLVKKISILSRDEKEGYFCSELIAKAYKHIGILNQTISASQYWPRSFSTDYEESELPLYDSAKLEPEQIIILRSQTTLS